MTEADDRDDPALRPAWRRDRRSAPPVPEAETAPEPPADPAEPRPEESDVDRGRTLALLGALGRLQLSVDMLARQQKKHAEAVEERLDRIERALYEEPGDA